MTAVGGEVARKVIHMAATVGAAAVVLLLPPLTAATILAAATALALAVEALRMASPRVGLRFQAVLRPMLRRREARRITGATTLAIGFTVAAVAFPGTAAAAGILFAGIGDAVAAVVGRRWGRHRYPGGKSLEGSATFFAAALLIGLGLGLAPWIAVTAAITTALLEALTLPVDDNLYLPAVAAAVFAVLASGSGLPFFS